MDQKTLRLWSELQYTLDELNRSASELYEELCRSSMPVPITRPALQLALYLRG